MRQVEDLLPRAIAALRGDDLEKAERLCRAMIAATDDNFGTHHVLGLVLARQARFDEALTSYDAALALQPDNSLALVNRGNALLAAGKPGKALLSYDRALTAAPAYPDALTGRAAALQRLDRLDEALASSEAALSLQPQHRDALINRGKILHDLRRFDEALAAHDRALVEAPGDPQPRCNRGATLHALSRHEEALAEYAAVLVHRPGNPDALANQGAAYRALARFDEALASYDAVLAIDPDRHEARFNRALVHLQLGSFATGWGDYEARRAGKAWQARQLASPEWRGESLHGKRLLLYAEQGLGDTIQFIRFAPAFAARGAEIIVEVQPQLDGLMGSLAGIPQIVLHGDPLPPADFHLPLMSAPFALRVEGRLPAATPYLAADPGRTAAWAARLPKAGLRVGIAWQGNPNVDIDRGRSIPLAAFAPLGLIPGVQLISLQKHAGSEQLRQLPPGMQVASLGEAFDAGPDAFLDSTAVMMNLDLIITSDSAIAHLAGALARPVWIVLAHVPDWRWLLDRPDSPWYPTARLFRQPRPGDWVGVFEEIAAALATYAGETGCVSSAP
ncbi:MAG TPA: tetratricopeptide repeat protein [Stellaceae bacterium]|nr:tetratricopeptide repeat protein [Stellaceae bacterium]